MIYYLVYYVLGLILLISAAVASHWVDLFSGFPLFAWLACLAWLLLYPVMVIRAEYRRLRRLLERLQALRRGERPQTREEAVEWIMEMGGDSLGLPEFLVRRYLSRFYSP